jgi:hypothetical protein
MKTPQSTDRACLPLGKRGAFEGVARRHGRRRNSGKDAASELAPNTNQPALHNAQHWVEKVSGSIKGSDTPQIRSSTWLASGNKRKRWRRRCRRRSPDRSASPSPDRQSPRRCASGAGASPFPRRRALQIVGSAASLLHRGSPDRRLLLHPRRRRCARVYGGDADARGDRPPSVHRMGSPSAGVRAATRG